MNGKKVLGIVFANIHEEALDSLTAMRTMGSVPFCSRFRLIDFPCKNRCGNERKFPVTYGPRGNRQTLGSEQKDRRSLSSASFFNRQCHNVGKQN